LDSAGSDHDPMASSCEYGNKLSGYIKGNFFTIWAASLSEAELCSVSNPSVWCKNPGVVRGADILTVLLKPNIARHSSQGYKVQFNSDMFGCLGLQNSALQTFYYA